jgi:CheY-like chemotaxis protein
MNADESESRRRILVIDDLTEIHGVFRKLLRPKRTEIELGRLESSLFGADETAPLEPSFEVDTASQGEEGLALVRGALAEGRPYAAAFVDMRMPPGWCSWRSSTARCERSRQKSGRPAATGASRSQRGSKTTNA